MRYPLTPIELLQAGLNPGEKLKSIGDLPKRDVIRQFADCFQCHFLLCHETIMPEAPDPRKRLLSQTQVKTNLITCP